MRDRCIAAVQRAAGRELTKKEALGVEERLQKWMRLGARRDPAAWRQMSQGERMDAAAQSAIDELLFEANLQKFRLQRQIEVHDRLRRELGSAPGGALDGLKRKIAAVTDGKGSFRSIETLANSVRTDALRRLTDAFEALDPRLFGLFENTEGVVAFTRALFGKRDGLDPKIIKAAEAWLEVAADLREQFNAAGGKIGRLADWALPQHHSQMKVAKAGADQWVADVLPKLDRTKYVNDDGTLFDDDAMRAFLRAAWRSIATNGLDDLEPGARGSSMVANRRAAHREIHFKGPDEYLAYQAGYGEKGLLQVMTDHVAGLSKEIAAVEEFGPNPEATFAFLRDQARQQAAESDPTHVGRYEEQAVKLTNLWNFVAGEQPPVAREWLARGMDGLRNWLVATKLGGAVLASFSDEGTVAITAKMNNLPWMQVFANELRGMNLTNKEEIRQARRAGLALDTLLGDLHRWGNESLAATVPAKLAHATLKASGLNALTDVRRRAFGVTMMDSIGHLTRSVESLYRLDADDHKILLSKGITDADWQVWRLAQPERWGGNDSVLTPDAIYAVPDAALAHMITDLEVQGRPGSAEHVAAVRKIRRDAALKLIGAVAEEVDMAVITPKALEREAIGGGLQRGTVKGELARSVFLFKATPISVVFRHFSRAMAQDSAAGKAAYLAAFIASTTILGAFSMQVKELVAGRDPRPLLGNPKWATRNWVQAMLQGGGFGLYGDFLFSGVTQAERSPAAAFLGPVVGLAEDLFKLTQGNLVQAAQGKETHFGAELIRFGKSNTPLQNLWYTKAALDHLIVHDLQEMASPGYLKTMQKRMATEFGQRSWWAPGEALPDRAPDLGRAVGE